MTLDALRARLQHLGLYGLRAQAETLATEPWLERLLAIEEAERQRRSLSRRLGNARLGTFKPLADFDWHWPTTCNRPLIEELLTLDFLPRSSPSTKSAPSPTTPATPTSSSRSSPGATRPSAPLC